MKKSGVRATLTRAREARAVQHGERARLANPRPAFLNRRRVRAHELPEPPRVAAPHDFMQAAIFGDVALNGFTGSVGKRTAFSEGDLSALFDLLPPEAMIPLPHREVLETAFGVSLADVEVYIGPGELFAALGVEAVTRGEKIIVPDPSPDLATMAHEIAHVLQARQGSALHGREGEPPKSDGSLGIPEPGGAREACQIIPLEAQAEQEAAHLADLVTRRANEPGMAGDFAPLAVETGLAMDALAFFRTTGRPAAAPTRADPATSRPPERVEPERERPSERPAETPEEREGEAAGAESPAGAPSPQAVEELPELPPPPEPGVTPEAVAAREAELAAAQAALETADDVDTLIAGYADAPPTLKAGAYAALGENVSRIAQTENETFNSNLPDFHARMSGEETAEIPELRIETPPVEEPTLEATPPPPAPPIELPPVPDPGDYTANDNVVRSLRSLGGSGAERQDDLVGTLRSVQTTDPDLSASLGEAPTVPLEGETDPQRLTDQSSEAAAQAQTAREQAAQAVINGPGPEQVQLRTLDEAVPIGELQQISTEPPAPVEGTQAYLDMNLPPEVQTAFDANQNDQMRDSLSEARANIEQAASDRDTQRQEQLDEANRQADELETQANADQNAHVMEARQRIQTERQNTLDQQTQAVQATEAEIDTRRETDREAINTRVEDDEAQVRDRYTQAETDAQAEIDRGEREAEQERARAEDEAEEESWWDAALDFIQDAFEALTSAINAIFDAVRSAVNAILDAARDFAVGLINAARDFIHSAIEAFADFLRDAVQALLGDVFPELAQALTEFIDETEAFAHEAVDAVADTLIAGVNALVEWVRSGLNAILDAWQAAINAGLSILQAALTGDWAALARMVLEAVLTALGIDPQEFYEFVGQAQETFSIIINDPGAFLGHVLDAVTGGFQRFADNLLTHLQAGIIGWLTGALGGAGITLPDTFDLMGVLDLVRQILGLTWERLREKAVRLIGETAVEILEFVASYLQTLIEGGWAALFERIQDDLSNLVDMVLQGIRDFIVERIIVAAITRLATMFNPVGALLNLALAIWNFYQFISDRLRQIFEVVQTVVRAMSDIAHGIIEPAAMRVEETLARLLPLAIDLLARLIGLGNVGARVREIIEDVRAVIDRAIDNLIERIRALFRGGGAAAPGEAGAPEGEETVGVRLTIEVPGREPHHLYIRLEGRDATVMVESDLRTVGQLHRLFNDNLSQVAEAQRPTAERLLGQLQTFNSRAESTAERPNPAPADVLAAEQSMVGVLRQLFALYPAEIAARAAAESELAERFAAQISAADQAAQGDILNALREVPPAVRALPADQWPQVRRSLEEQPFYQRPLLASTRFGQVVQGEVRAGLAALAGRQTPPLPPPANPDTFISQSLLPRIHDSGGASDEYGNALTALRERIFNGGTRATAQARLNDATVAALVAYGGGGTPNPQVQAAVRGAGGIVPFMHQIGVQRRPVAGYDFAAFQQIFNSDQPTRDWLKDQFRGPGGRHEWIPSNYMDRVIAQAHATSSAGDLVGAAAWIRVYDALRAPTSSLIFFPVDDFVRTVPGRPEVEGSTGSYYVLQGHVGAVYAKVASGGQHSDTIEQQTHGQNIWHDELRDTFDEASASGPALERIENAIIQIRRYFATTIWNGQVSQLPARMFNQYYNRGLESSPTNIAGLGGQQAPAYTAARDDLNEALEAVGG